MFFDKKKKENWQLCAKLSILWYDLFGENHTPLQKNGMAAIPKNEMKSVGNVPIVNYYFFNDNDIATTFLISHSNESINKLLASGVIKIPSDS